MVLLMTGFLEVAELNNYYYCLLHTPLPIMLNFSSILLLSSAQKISYLANNYAQYYAHNMYIIMLILF